MQLDQWRVSDGYFNTKGQWVATDNAVRRSLHESLGVDAHGPATGELTPTWFVDLGNPAPINSEANLVLEDGTEVWATDRLPPDLPLGAHRLIPADAGPTTNLFVVPSRQHRPSRSWGWGSQIYATRSESSWGHGDLADLGKLATWALTHGAALVAHNPLGSSLPLEHQEPSPYFGSSRRFLSVLYLNVEGVAGADRLGPELAGLARAGRALNASRTIDRDQVFLLKMTALDLIWTDLRSHPRLMPILEASDTLLTRHSIFCALAETYGSGWSGWPARFRHPESPAVDEFHRDNKERIDFWRWIHMELERQLAEASVTGAGLMADLAVGFDPDGSDAWVDQDLLALECRIGAPGDDFNPDGQDWGVTPYVPWKLRNAAYEPWLQTLRRTLRNCAGLRIDHVMGLFRLFWIPQNVDRSVSESANGAYVYQYGTELLDLALMEAAKAGVWLAGEDLGTVESDVRNSMASRGVLGYKVGWFEDTNPPDWPDTTIGSLNTHDLATVARVWEMAEGRTGGPIDESDQLLIDRLTHLADPDASTGLSHASIDDVILAAHGSLASAGSAVVLASLDDAQAVVEQPNHPGTIDEFPNWRLALPVPIEDFDTTLAPQIAELMLSRNEFYGHTDEDGDSDNLASG